MATPSRTHAGYDGHSSSGKKVKLNLKRGVRTFPKKLGGPGLKPAGRRFYR